MIIVKIMSLPDAVWGTLKSINGTVLDVGSILEPGTFAMTFDRNLSTVNGVCVMMMMCHVQNVESTKICFTFAMYTDYRPELQEAIACMMIENVLDIVVPVLQVNEESQLEMLISSYITTAIPLTTQASITSLPSVGTLSDGGVVLTYVPYNASAVTYSPPLNYYGVVSFNIDASGTDGVSNYHTAEKTVTITVVNVPDVTIITVDNSTVTSQACPGNVVNLTASIQDSDPTEILTLRVYAHAKNQTTGYFNDEIVPGAIEAVNPPADLWASCGVSLYPMYVLYHDVIMK